MLNRMCLRERSPKKEPRSAATFGEQFELHTLAMQEARDEAEGNTRGLATAAGVAFEQHKAAMTTVNQDIYAIVGEVKKGRKVAELLKEQMKGNFCGTIRKHAAVDRQGTRTIDEA